MPDTAAAHRRRGDAWFASKEWARALDNYNPYLSKHGDDVEVLRKRARVCEELGHWANAKSDHERVLDLAGEDDEAAIRRAWCLVEMREIETALEEYARMLESRPASCHAQVLHDRGCAWQRMGRHESALEDFERSLDLRPNSALTLTGKGRALRDIGRIEEAIDSCDRALCIDSYCAPAYLCRGQC